MSFHLDDGRIVRLWHVDFIRKADRKRALAAIAQWDTSGSLDDNLDQMICLIRIAAGGEHQARPLVEWLNGDIDMAIEILRRWHALHRG